MDDKLKGLTQIPENVFLFLSSKDNPQKHEIGNKQNNP